MKIRQSGAGGSGNGDGGGWNGSDGGNDEINGKRGLGMMNGRENIIAIIGAMGIELRYLRDKMHIISEEEVSGFKFMLGTLHGVNLVLAKSGPGKENASRCCEVLIEEYCPKKVVNIGIAGALDDRLNIGDVVIADETVQFEITEETSLKCETVRDEALRSEASHGESAEEKRLSYEALQSEASQGVTVNVTDVVKTDAWIPEEVFKHCKVYLGSVATGDIFLQNEVLKRKILEKTGSLTIDMESGAVAAQAAMLDVSCSIVRAVSDRADGTPVSEWKMPPEKCAERAAIVLENSFL